MLRQVNGGDRLRGAGRQKEERRAEDERGRPEEEEVGEPREARIVLIVFLELLEGDGGVELRSRRD